MRVSKLNSFCAKFFIICFFLLFPNTFCLGAEYYLSPDGSDSGDGSIESPWFSLDYALNKYRNNNTYARVGPGDTLYLRGGVYDLTAMDNDGKSYAYIIINSYSGSETLTIKSYPGEWAIFDGGNGNDDNSGTIMLTSNTANYNVVFEDFEVRNCKTSGIGHDSLGTINPVFIGCTFRNIYFHGCKSTSVNANPAGLKLSGQNCIVEYCTFYDNGTTGASHHNNANLILYNSYSNNSGESETASQARSGNIVRYCVMDGAGSGIKDKGDSNFVDSSSPDQTNASWANEIHHNIIMNTRGDAYYSCQDFVKFHHNLIIDCSNGVRLHAPAESDKSIWWNKIYSNTFYNCSNWAVAIEPDNSGNTNLAFSHELYNNIFKDNGAELIFFTAQSTVFIVSSDYNYWDSNDKIGRRCNDSVASFSRWQSSYGYDNNGKQGGVIFIDPNNNDYRLTDDSIGKDAKSGSVAGAFGDYNWYSSAGYNADGKQLLSIDPPQNLRIVTVSSN